MVAFREENLYFLYVCCFFGLYMTSLDSVISKKWLIIVMSVWSKIPICVLPVYISWDVRSLIFDEESMFVKLAMARKVIVFISFFAKNVIFYWQRRKIERLIDVWDCSFREDINPELNRIIREKNQKATRKLVRNTLTFSAISALSYSVPTYFSKKKEFSHPSGIIYPHRSPEFEIAVTFDVISALSCISTVAFDSLLAVLLSHIRAKLHFLRDALAEIIDQVIIDDEGRLMGRQTPAGGLPRDSDSSAAGGKFLYREIERNTEEFDSNVGSVEHQLRIWILHHQQIISFFEELKKVYSGTATFQLGLTVIYTSLTAFHIVQVKLSPVTLSIALVASSNLVSLFLWCKLAAEFSSIYVFSEGFSRAWFLYPRKIKDAFSFIIMRSKKPLVLYGAAIFSIDLVTFFEILKLAYQFCAFMMNITDESEKAGQAESQAVRS